MYEFIEFFPLNLSRKIQTVTWVTGNGIMRFNRSVCSSSLALSLVVWKYCLLFFSFVCSSQQPHPWSTMARFVAAWRHLFGFRAPAVNFVCHLTIKSVLDRFERWVDSNPGLWSWPRRLGCCGPQPSLIYIYIFFLRVPYCQDHESDRHCQKGFSLKKKIKSSGAKWLHRHQHRPRLPRPVPVSATGRRKSTSWRSTWEARR